MNMKQLPRRTAPRLIDLWHHACCSEATNNYMLMFHELAYFCGYTYNDIRRFHSTAAAMEILALHKYIWEDETDGSN